MAGGDLAAYYTQRALEYERVYQKPERQPDLRRLRSWLREALGGHCVLEIACGTGYWTQVIGSVAATITATDASPAVLDLARRKEYPPGRLRFAVADAYALDRVDGEFTAGLAAFWWSHVPRERQGVFLRGFHQRLGAGSVVVLMDNRFVEGSSTAISRRDAAGNTYQQRRLADGTTHEVLKNFPTATELEAVLSPLADELNLAELAYYWMVRYRVG